MGGAGEGPLLVAEQFALEKGVRYGDAVDHEVGAFGPQAVLVDGAGHQFLARARLAAYQYQRVRGRGTADGLVDLVHGAARAHQRLGVTAVTGLGRHGHPSAHPAARLHRLVDEREDVGDVEGLQDVVERTELGGFDGSLGGGVGRHDDDRETGVDLPQGLQRIKAVHARHAHVHDHALGQFLAHHA